MIRSLYILCTLLILFACQQKVEVVPPPVPQGVADLNLYEQRVSAYIGGGAEERLLSAAEQRERDQRFNDNFFAPWHRQRASRSAGEVFWGIKHYGEKEGFAENLQPFPAKEWQRLVALQQIDFYPSMARPAITVRNTSLRLFPTERPFFLSFNLPGEGFPFDYFQTSAIAIGNPLLATHSSSDGAWTFVESNFAYGWVATDALAWIDGKILNRYENGTYAAVLQDDTPLRSRNGTFLAQADLGALFPISKMSKEKLTLYIPVRSADGNAELRIAEIKGTAAALKPIPVTPAAIARLADPLIGQKYGWGGLYDNRDCSSTMRDLFVPFGIWLGRNSQKQGLSGGEFIDLRELPLSEKAKKIREQGIPFATLIWLKGHIGLYLGVSSQSGEPLLLHSVWGVHIFDQTGKEGREVIGRLAITSLRPGEERPDVHKDEFYQKILGMAVLTSPTGK